jgi:DegV family protein with EDD domain
MQPEQFYRMLGKTPIYPTTSQPGFKEFLNRYNYLSTHYDSIIGIHMSNKMSGTWQNSLNAATQLVEQDSRKIDVLSSNTTTNALGLIVLRAARELEAGMTHDDVVAKLPNWARNTKLLVSASTMKYMVRSGRVTATQGFIGKLLGIKPIISINSEGYTESFGKPLTLKQSRQLIMNYLRKMLDGKQVWGYAISHADNPKIANFYAEEMEKLTGKKPEFIKHASPVLVTHVGIGVTAVSVMVE